MARRNNLNKVIFALNIILLFCNVFAENLDLISDKYILYNLNDNKILMQKNENEETQIASLTKIMTIIVAIENITDFDEKVTITKDMVNNIEWDVAKIGLKSGDIVTYNDLLYVFNVLLIFFPFVKTYSFASNICLNFLFFNEYFSISATSYAEL